MNEIACNWFSQKKEEAEELERDIFRFEEIACFKSKIHIGVRKCDHLEYINIFGKHKSSTFYSKEVYLNSHISIKKLAEELKKERDYMNAIINEADSSDFECYNCRFKTCQKFKLNCKNFEFSDEAEKRIYDRHMEKITCMKI